MYVLPPDLDDTTLLQGDIISGVQILAALNYGNIQYLTPAHGEGEIQGWSVLAKPVEGDVMVISHSCEVARENGVKVTSIILAPLRDVSGATRPEKVQELIESNLIDQSEASASYLKYFYLEPCALLPYDKGSVVDFSKCFSIRKNSYDTLLSRKKVELNVDTRSSMALKLALYFHRRNQDRAA